MTFYLGKMTANPSIYRIILHTKDVFQMPLNFSLTNALRIEKSPQGIKIRGEYICDLQFGQNVPKPSFYRIVLSVKDVLDVTQFLTNKCSGSKKVIKRRG